MYEIRYKWVSNRVPDKFEISVEEATVRILYFVGEIHFSCVNESRACTAPLGRKMY